MAGTCQVFDELSLFFPISFCPTAMGPLYQTGPNHQASTRIRLTLGKTGWICGTGRASRLHAFHLPRVGCVTASIPALEGFQDAAASLKALWMSACP